MVHFASALGLKNVNFLSPVQVYREWCKLGGDCPVLTILLACPLSLVLNAL